MKKFTRWLLPGLLFFDALVGAKSALATAGNLDPTFGNGGVIVTRSSTGFTVAYALKLQSDGKILVLAQAGDLTTEVLRYTSAGMLDKSFGSNGVAALPTAFSPLFGNMTIQANGQIVVAGEVSASVTDAAAFGVERLNADGTADTAFGSDGLAIASIGFPGTQAVLLIQPDGDLLLGAQLEPLGRHQPFRTALARFTSAGDLDTTFGNQGTVSVPAVGGCSALALLSSDEILVVNAQDIAQFTPDGSLESTVTGGTVVASAGSNSPSTPSIFQENGDYLLGSELFTGEESRAHNAAAEVLRFTETGAADTTFANPTFHYIGTGGSGIEALVNALAVQSDGDIVVVGNQIRFAQSGDVTVNGLARLTPNGELDPTFGNGGTVVNSVPAGTVELNGVVIQPADDKIITVGIADNNNNNELTLSRYLAH
jgi:uncharacterized delta-60 repeat protein